MGFPNLKTCNTSSWWWLESWVVDPSSSWENHMGLHGVFFFSILLRSLSSKTSMDFLNSQENVGSWSEIWKDDICVEDGNFVVIVAWFYMKVWTKMFLMFNVKWEKWINEDRQVWRFYHDPVWKWWYILHLSSHDRDTQSSVRVCPNLNHHFT